MRKIKLSLLAAAIPLLSAGCHRGGMTTASMAAALPPGVSALMVAEGDTIFNTRSCKNCHELKGIGGVRGPNLTDQTWIHVDGSYEAIVSLVTTGFTKAEQRDPRYRFTMNPRGGVKLTDDQIKSVAAYVWSLSHPVGR